MLAVGVRYSEVSTANYAIPQHDVLIHVDVNPHNLGRNVPADVEVCVRLARCSSTACWPTATPCAALPARSSGSTSTTCARSTAARPPRCGSPRASIRCSS